MSLVDRFTAQGWCLVDSLVSAETLASLDARLQAQRSESAGTRNLLVQPWCATLSSEIRRGLLDRRLIDSRHAVVQCTLLDKSAQRNWLVPWHQDVFIPASGGGHPTVLKEGEPYLQPSAQVMASLLAVRLHLDDCGPDVGPLRVLSGSHRHALLSDAQIDGLRMSAQEAACVAAAGDALVMRPLLLHASSRVRGAHRRRVLHFLIGPAVLPDGMSWNRRVTGAPNAVARHLSGA